MNKLMKSVRNLEERAARTKGKMSLKLRRNAPTLMTAGGVCLVLAGTGLACKATLKLPDILDETKDALDKLKACKDGESSKKDKTKVYLKAAGKTAKEYAPAAVCMGTGIGLIVGSHNIMRSRNASMAACYAALDSAYRKYRDRVKDKYGEEAERDIRYGITRDKIEITETDENGKTKKKKVEVEEIKNPMDLYSPYAKFFDESCAEWTKDPEYNLTFLRLVQNHMNDLLKARGHLFLNEVYDALGITRTSVGNRVGWIYDLKNPNGDNFVDFGLYDYDKDRVRAFINCDENVILLDFNVDGSIIDSI